MIELPGITRVGTEPGRGDRADMKQFPATITCARRPGCAPATGSAGKRKSGRTLHGTRWLKAALCQSAWAAVRTKGSYFGALYHRLAGRRGKKRALVAVAHAQLKVIYHLLRSGES